MRNRTRVIAATAAVTATLAAGSTAAAMASTTGAKPGTHARTVSASEKPGSAKAAEQRGQDAITAAVAQQLHVSTTQVSAALRQLFAAGRADPSSPAFAAAARSLGVSTQQLATALMHAKQSLAQGTHAEQSPVGSKSAGSKAAKAAGSKAAEQRGQDAITAAVAQQLHVSTTQVSAALRQLFAAGRADPSSPAFAAAARSLGVSTQQLATALMHAKQSLAQGS